MRNIGKLERKAVSGMMLTLLLTSMLSVAFNVATVEADPRLLYSAMSNPDL